MRKVCIFTATRAEWGLLRPLAQQVEQSQALQLQLLVSGSHIAEKSGMTVAEIEADGLPIAARVDILQFDDSPQGICQTMGLALGRYGAALTDLKPDILVILGDRYEAFCVAAAAAILCIPVAHLHGGETTEGAVDEAFRHSITKMAQLHFPCCEQYRRRIIQLGENPQRVFNVGALGIENIRRLALMSRDELQASLGFELELPFFLVTFHPVTLEQATAATQFGELLAALGQFPRHKIIFTGANADSDGAIINTMIRQHAAAHPQQCLAIDSLGLRRYLSAMKLCAAVIGNSSSGILEAPVMGVPTVNIGDRQKGRLRTPSIIDCAPRRDAIVAAITTALAPDFLPRLAPQHPCEQADTAEKITRILQTVDLTQIIKKSFYDLEGS